jgi:nuclear pore complex protein Nup107
MYLYKYLGVTEAEEKQQCLELAREAGLNIPAITKTVVENIRSYNKYLIYHWHCQTFSF